MYRPTILSTAGLCALALFLGACGKDDEPEQRGSATTGQTQTAKRTTPAPATTATTTKTAPPEPEKTAGGCDVVREPKPQPTGNRNEPNLRLDRDKTYTAVLRTSCGRIEIRLDIKASPETTASFVDLARDEFFDGLIFHRVAKPGGMPFVIQAGDPTASGSGDAGYRIVEAPPENATYKRGTVAMAKGELEEPGTNSSQFFIVTGKDSQLPAEYAILGRVRNGLSAVDRISNVPIDPTTDRPLEPVVIESVRIESR